MTLTGVNEQCKIEWQYASSKKAVIAKSVCIKAAFQTYKSVQIKMKPFSFIKSTFYVIFHSMNKFLNESQDWTEKRLNKCRVWTLLICQHLHNNLSVKTVILSWNISFVVVVEVVEHSDNDDCEFLVRTLDTNITMCWYL